ncbi:hypothetical protein IscW_ISCW011942 [Ixodes scapularis]|uniref:Uncharacterized protein n=1 Tax=Ixodes scapularis TaxID=6945 RepID=B7QF18_IXOSC|nr:hypothetical protein IscW_ISCW011942 [Ixodes scapularis]|eukprot:XP_002414132.1 hypothetical protein IscW_ISCW011942 [Ixodes scapularis]
MVKPSLIKFAEVASSPARSPVADGAGPRSTGSTEFGRDAQESSSNLRRRVTRRQARMPWETAATSRPQRWHKAAVVSSPNNVDLNQLKVKARFITMKFAGLTVILGFAAFVGWAEAGILHQRKVLQDFVEKSDLQLRQLKKLLQGADPQLWKEIRQHVEGKLELFEGILDHEGDVQPRTGLGQAGKVLKDYLVSTEKQYKQLRQLLKTADPALQEEIRVAVEKKIGHFRALLDIEGRKAGFRPDQAVARPLKKF